MCVYVCMCVSQAQTWGIGAVGAVGAVGGRGKGEGGVEYRAEIDFESDPSPLSPSPAHLLATLTRYHILRTYICIRIGMLCFYFIGSHEESRRPDVAWLPPPRARIHGTGRISQSERASTRPLPFPLWFFVLHSTCFVRCYPARSRQPMTAAGRIYLTLDAFPTWSVYHVVRGPAGISHSIRQKIKGPDYMYICN